MSHLIARLHYFSDIYELDSPVSMTPKAWLRSDNDTCKLDFSVSMTPISVTPQCLNATYNMKYLAVMTL
jgi:hypothetical protein